ncbi:hypothetical protein AHiyo8_01010 [Arthrobacter sp. Hiyo8]|nr:hypothetical protein AHiyo8_01010 [Arthrobacter sp. Hiyo8]
MDLHGVHGHDVRLPAKRVSCCEMKNAPAEYSRAFVCEGEGDASIRATRCTLPSGARVEVVHRVNLSRMPAGGVQGRR